MKQILNIILRLGYKQEQQSKPKIKKDKKTWQHITEKKEL
jgi:hypothetical protein